MTEIIKTNKDLLKAPHELQHEVLNSLHLKGIGGDRIASKLDQLLDATTINNNGDTMADNKAQLDALKLILKLNGAKLDSGVNFNFFNMPNPNDNLKY